jgi:hypothetical protein
MRNDTLKDMVDFAGVRVFIRGKGRRTDGVHEERLIHGVAGIFRGWTRWRELNDVPKPDKVIRGIEAIGELRETGIHRFSGTGNKDVD